MPIGVIAALAGCLDKPPFVARDAEVGGDGVPPPVFDEDEDGAPDATDACPHLPAPQLDEDGDGIGDDCDYDPGGDGEIVRFWGFADGNLDELMLTGDVQVGDGDLTFASQEPAVPAFAFVTPHFRSLEVDVGFEILAYPGTGTGDLRIYSARPIEAIDETTGAICDLMSPDGNPSFVRTVYDTTIYGATITADGFASLRGRLHQLHVEGASLECDSLDLSFGQGVHVVQGGPPVGTGAVAVSAKGATVRIRYLYVVGRRP
jgi:hypothetical protein